MKVENKNYHILPIHLARTPHIKQTFHSILLIYEINQESYD
jgi:hypothetical protein